MIKCFEKIIILLETNISMFLIIFANGFLRRIVSDLHIILEDFVHSLKFSLKLYYFEKFPQGVMSYKQIFYEYLLIIKNLTAKVLFYSHFFGVEEFSFSIY